MWGRHRAVLAGLAAMGVLLSGRGAAAQTATVGGNWAQASPVATPSARYISTMAYDAANGTVVSFGGSNNASNLGDTWAWNGTTWAQQLPATSPSARNNATMAYDAATGTIVLFGGSATGGDLSDTWVWNGTTWAQQSPATSPSARSGATMAYDAATGMVVLFGGSDGSGGILSDTWVWNGTTWAQLSPASSPGARNGATMAYDVATGTVVLFGGSSSSGALLNDTWSWNGTTWAQQSPATSPSARFGATMAYNAATGTIVLFGGDGSSGILNDTWFWNGTTWTQPAPGASPTAREDSAMAYDAATGTVVLFGGDGSGLLDDTWTYSAGSFVVPSSVVATAAAQTPVYFTIGNSGTLGTPQVLTMGISGLDFTLGTGSTCAGTPAANTTCTVNVAFTPTRPGLRPGAVNLTNSSGTVIATAYISGTGTGPLATFIPGAISTVAGNGTATFGGDGGVAISASLSNPDGVSVDGAGNLYIADGANNRIRKVTAATGFISTVAGNGTATFGGDGAAATSASLNNPDGVSVDGAGNLYIADEGNNRIRKVTAATGFISTVAGDGTAGFTASQDMGTTAATSASLNNPDSVFVDGAGNLYIADEGNNRIREVIAGTGFISTIAGNGTATFAGDGGVAISASLNNPDGVSVDGAGNLYIADGGNNRIRKVTAATGFISTVAGNGTAGFTASEDTGTTAATSASLDNPDGVSVDGAGNLYIADQANNRIRKVTAATGFISTLAGNGTAIFGGDGGEATSASLNNPGGVSVDGAGDLYIADQANNRIRKVTASAAPLTFATTATGATSSDSPQTVTMANAGNAPLVFLVPASGTNPAFNTQSFSVMSGSATTCPQLTSSHSGAAPSLAAGASCTYGFEFAPQVVGSLIDDAVLVNNSLNLAPATQSIALSATATGDSTDSLTASSIAVGPTSLVEGNFATVTVHLENAEGFGIEGLNVTVTTSSANGSATFLSGGAGNSATGTSDSNGNVILSVTDSVAETVTLTSTATGTQSAVVTFVGPSYLVTTLTDDATGTAGKCVTLATDNTGGNSACSLRDAIAAANAQPSGVNATISFWSGISALAAATQASPAVYSVMTGGTLSLTRSVTINGLTSGSGSSLVNLIAVDGGGTTQVFEVNAGGNAVAINNLTIRNGFGGNGGGMTVAGGTVMVNNSTFSGNQSGAGGGGMFVTGGTVTVSHSTFSANMTNAVGGGGLLVENGTVTVSNSTFSANTTNLGDGGGMLVDNGTATVSNSTFSANQATGGNGGGVAAMGGTVNLYNSVVAGNSATASADVFGPLNANVGNIVGTGGSGTSTINPMLGALIYNGGSTQTMLPEPGSQAICGGLQTISGVTISATDQRGATHSSAYCAAGQIDAGAVQTNYSLGAGFTTSPATVVSSGVVMNPAPAVTITENGLVASGASVAMTAASGALAGTTSVSSGSTGLATFSNLSITGALPDDTLTATLTLNSAAAAPNSISVSSNTFSALTLSAPTTLTGQAGVPYNQSVVPANGIGPYLYAITSGPLPAGLSLGTSSGTISGTPTAVGSFPVTIQVTDTSSLATASVTFTLSISAPSIVLAPQPASLPALTVGVTPTLTFIASGGTAPYTYSVSSGVLPAGLTLNANGSVSGTPTTAASYSFTIQAADSTTGAAAPYSGSQSYSNVQVNKGTATVTFTPSSLIQTFTGSPLSAAATITPSSIPVSELTFTYTGTGSTTYGPTSAPPTNAGTYSVSALLTDSNFTGSASAVAFIINKATATVTLGNLAQTFTGSPLSATATTTPSGLSTVSFTYTGTGGTTYPTSATAPTNAGSYTVAATLTNANFTGTANGTLIISPATATITLGSLTQTFTGSPLSATATTTPAGLSTVSFTYTGTGGTTYPTSAAPPTNVGSYTVAATLTNVNFTGTASAVLTITKATATVTFTPSTLSQTFTGSPLSAVATITPSSIPVSELTFTYTGTGGTTYGPTSAAPTNVGTYTVSASLTDNNFTGSASAVAFTISKATATVTFIASTLSQTYTGSPLSAVATIAPSSIPVSELTYTYTGTGGTTYGPTSAAPTNVGTYTVSASLTDNNFTGSASAVAFTISKATATVSFTASTLSQTYTGSPLSAVATITPSSIPVSELTYTYTGTGGTTYGPTSAAPTNVGTYTVSALLTDANYTGTANAVFTITKATATVTFTASTLSQTYTGSPLSAAATVTPSSIPVSELTYTYTGTGSTTYASSTTPPTSGGTYTVSASLTDVNYTGTASAVFTITKAAATVTFTASTLSQIYTGSPLSAAATITPSTIPVSELTYTYVGTGSTTYASSTTSPTNAGTYTVSAALTDSNYSGSASAVSFTITKATATVTFTPSTLSQTYTGSPVSVAATITPSSIQPSELTYTYTGTGGTVYASTTPPTNVGTYSVSASLTDNNYTGSASAVAFIINKATVTVTANSAQRAYGAANPTFTSSVTGNLGSDTFTESYSTTATTTSNPGPYAIVPSVTGTNLADYMLSVIDGTLTIVKANTTTTLVPSALQVSPVGTITLTASVASVTTGTPTGSVTFYDGTTPLTTLPLSGGQVQYVLQASTIAAGVQHSFTAQYAGDGLDFNGSVSTAGAGSTVTVTPIDFTFTLSGGQVFNVVPGQSLAYTLQLSPLYQLYPGPVTFSVSGLPPGATAIISPASVAATAGPQTVTLTIQTAPATARNTPPAHGRQWAPVAFAFLLLPLAGLRRSRRRMASLLGVFLLMAAGLAATAGLTGCGTSDGLFGVNPKVYPVVLTATSGTVSHSVTININVE